MNKKTRLWIGIGIFVLLLIMNVEDKQMKKEAGPGGAVLTRSITPSSVAPGGTFTLKYSISGAVGSYGGIIYETIPSGYTIDPLSFLNNFDVFGKKITGQLIEMPFAGSVSGQYTQFNIVASSSSASLSNGYVEWADNLGTDSLGSGTLIVSGTASTTSTTTPSTTTTSYSTTTTSYSTTTTSYSTSTTIPGQTTTTTPITTTTIVAGEPTCEEIYGCELWEECNDAGTGCETAGWVYIAGAFVGIMFILSAIK